MFFLSLGRGKHTAHFQTTQIKVYYPFHPYNGRTISISGIKQHHGEIHFIITQPDGTKTYLPLWMTEPIAAHVSIVTKPMISINALLSLKKIVNISIKSFHHELQIKMMGGRMRIQMERQLDLFQNEKRQKVTISHQVKKQIKNLLTDLIGDLWNKENMNTSQNGGLENE